MTEWLMYWKHYWTDIEAYGPSAVNEDWHTSNERFFNRVRPGDILWAVISGGPEHSDEWRLLQTIHIRECVIDSAGEASKYGAYHVIGDPKQGQKFDLTSQPDFTSILHELEFESGRRIRAEGRLIGCSIQAARPLSDKDVDLLKDYARKLK